MKRKRSDLKKYPDNLEPSISELLQVIDIPKQEEVKKNGKHKRAGHLVDQFLKYDYPEGGSPQMSLFGNLREATKKAIESAGVDVEAVVEGIKPLPTEFKVIECICKLLHEKSQTEDPKQKNYYTGNVPPVPDPDTGHPDVYIRSYGGAPESYSKLAITLYELTKEYLGGEEEVSGKHMASVSSALLSLSNKKFLTKYKEEYKNPDGSRRVIEVEEFRPILTLPLYKETHYDKEGIEISKREETLIILHPIYKRQIETKFILYPNDLTKRTTIANGSHKIPGITLRLREHLIREHSSKRYTTEIYLDRLYYLVAESWMKEKRKGRVIEYLDRAIETVKALGLLLDHKVEKGKTTGEPKMVFYLNKNWE